MALRPIPDSAREVVAYVERLSALQRVAPSMLPVLLLGESGTFRRIGSIETQAADFGKTCTPDPPAAIARASGRHPDAGRLVPAARQFEQARRVGRGLGVT